MSLLPAYLVYIICFISALLLSLIFIPQVIKVSGKKMLFDKPDSERKFHSGHVPHLGGTGIFFAYIIPASIFLQQDAMPHWNNIMAAFLLLFITGLIDDLQALNATKKFAAQFLPAIIIAYVADIRIESLHGFLGIYQLPYWISMGFTIIGCMFITNAFNLIDGVDGLAACIGLVSCMALGIFLASAGNIAAAGLAFSMVGALSGFLKFNFPPARIFMGDSGSLPIGFTISVLCITLVNTTDGTNATALLHHHAAALIVAIAVLFIITVDSFRVFAARIMKGVSPFRGDRNHIHHYLLDTGFTQKQVVFILTAAHILIIALAYFLQDYPPTLTVGFILALAVLLFVWVIQRRGKKRAGV